MEPKYVQTSEQPGWMPICIHGECDDYMRVHVRQIPRLPAAAEVHPLAQQNTLSRKWRDSYALFALQSF